MSLAEFCQKWKEMAKNKTVQKTENKQRKILTT